MKYPSKIQYNYPSRCPHDITGFIPRSNIDPGSSMASGPSTASRKLPGPVRDLRRRGNFRCLLLQGVEGTGGSKVKRQIEMIESMKLIVITGNHW